MSGVILLCAGGTGGHLFPAEALAAELTPLGYTVHLATDERGFVYTSGFPAEAVHEIPSETIRGRSVAAMSRTFWKLGAGAMAAWRMLGRIRPAAVVGFGGYPTVPPLTAATWRRIPTLIHEQNAVMGRANRMLAERVNRIATGFPEVAKLAETARKKLVHTGNPVRTSVLSAAARPWSEPNGRFNLLVVGGSQGARVMSDVVPPAIAGLDPALRMRLCVVQQARAEDEERVRAAYAALGLAIEVAPFFKDLPERIAASHLVISRGGASTVAELAVIGRPSILVPLPGALDQDQAANARALQVGGGARLVPQPEFTPETLAVDLAALMCDPSALTAMAGCARAAGTTDAARRLAAEVHKIAR